MALGNSIPYDLLVFITGAFFLRFFLRLEKRYQLIFGLAGSLYVGAAIGFEMLEAFYAEKYGVDVWLYGILYTGEENLEILAMLFINWGLLDYLIRHCEGQCPTLRVTP